jgi:hypothetical protein
MRFWVYGIDSASKAPRDPLFLEADSPEAAQAQARELGMQAEEVEPVQPRTDRAAPAPPVVSAPSGIRRLILPLAALLLLGAGVAIGWFAARRQTPASGPQADSVQRGPEPALEPVPEAAEAMRLAGFQEAFVYRWRGALLDGYVLLDTGRATERVPLDTEKLARAARVNQRAAERLEGAAPAGEAPLDPSRLRGLLVIAIRPKAAGATGHECIAAARVEAEGQGTSGSASGNLLSGQLPDLTGGGGGGRGGGHAFYKLNTAGGQQRELFKLQLRGRE